MKIIKPGNTELLKKTKHFICWKCGCEFTADLGEYKSDTQRNETYYYCDCPTCKNKAYKDE